MAAIGLVDDHVLLRGGLAGLLDEIGHKVVLEADHGLEMIAKLGKGQLPEVILLDITMPQMDGYESAKWLKQNHPTIKVLALSMYDNESSIVRMLKNGAKGYLLKDCDPSELRTAINDLLIRGFYYSELVSGKLIHAINSLDDSSDVKMLLNITDKEIEFLKLVCTEMTYKEISGEMNLSPRTIDGYRENLFQKLNAKSRVGLVMFAIKNRIVAF